MLERTSFLFGYDPTAIFNMGKSEIFFKFGRRTAYCDKDLPVLEEKKEKNRITVALCASMTGEKIKPPIIGRCAKPRCFRRVKKYCLPVTYRHDKVWIN